MAKQAMQQPDLRAIPLLKTESLYIGIDVGKVKHVAGCVSSTLLSRHQRFEACPHSFLTTRGSAFARSLIGYKHSLRWNTLSCF